MPLPGTSASRGESTPERYRADGLHIYEAPDAAAAGAAASAATRRGHLGAIKTTPLFTAEEGMEMMRRAGGTAFRAPGQ